MKMKPLPLKTAAEVTGGKYIGDASLENTLITSVVQDSRKVTGGSLFLCIPGERVDGHDFAAAAYAAGAACCIAERELPCLLEVDGGVDAATAPLCIAAGATVLVAGSAVFNKSDRAAAIAAIRGI